MVDESESSWRTLKTVETSMKIIEALEQMDGGGVTEVADYVGVSTSTTHSHLSTLHQAGYLIKENKHYKLSYQFLRLGEFVRSTNPLYKFGRTKTDQLARETGHYAHLYIEQQGFGVFIYSSIGELSGEHAYQQSKLQKREPLHITASGKAILANYETEHVKEIIHKHGLSPHTENTITNKETFLNELEQVSEQGYATNDEEEVTGFRAVAAPVIVDGKGVIGSLSVSGPTAYLSGDIFRESIPKKLMEVANLIQVDINMSN